LYSSRILNVYILSIITLAKKLNILLLVPLLLVVNCHSTKKWHTSTLLVFDTVCEIKIFCSPSKFISAMKETKRIFSNIEDCFSPDSEDHSSLIVLDLFRRSSEVYQNSNGYFDITVGPLSRLWGFLDKSHSVPDPQKIQSALKHIGLEKIKIKNDTLILPPGMKLDWGAIAKGFGIDLASQALIEMGITKGFINAGGDLYCWGKNPDFLPWNIGIKHPRKSGFLGVMSISHLGAATTGDYQRYFMANNVRYHHVFDPRTGYPAQGKQSVTVIGPETLLCDALSTALFVSQQPEGILKKYPNYGAIIVDSDGSLYSLGKAYPFHLIE